MDEYEDVFGGYVVYVVGGGVGQGRGDLVMLMLICDAETRSVGVQ